MRKAILAIFFVLGFIPLMAQNYTISQSDSEVMIAGTSTIHDWEAPAEEFSGTATLKVTESVIDTIESLELKVVVEEINSGKGGMDKKIDDALNEKKHPNITFVLTEVASIENGVITANGDLTIAGFTNKVQLTVNYEVLESGTIVFSGSKDIKMTDYKVDPPTAMLGTIKAGDEVTVSFDTKFVQAQSQQS